MNENVSPILPPPMANGFGAFGRGRDRTAGQSDRQPYLDVDAFLARLNPLHALREIAGRCSGRSPRCGKPARSTSYLSQPATPALKRAVKQSPLLNSLAQPQPPKPSPGGG